MKNTGIMYTSEERTPTVLPEMSELLPPLTDEQLASLEEDIVQNGCYAPVIVNEDLVVIDGHNRKAVCEKHGLSYSMAVFSFGDMLEAKQWALDTQKARRNLSINELCKIALKLRPEVEARAKANQGTRTDLCATLHAGSPVDTKKELAKAVGVGEHTMSKAMQIEDKAPQAVKDAVDSGEITIHQGYNLTKELLELPDEQQEQAAKEAVEREIADKLEKRKRGIDEKTRIAKLFNKAFEMTVQLKPTEENVMTWVDQSGILYDQLDGAIRDAEKAAETYSAIAEHLKYIKKERSVIYDKAAEDGEGHDFDGASDELPDSDGENA